MSEDLHIADKSITNMRRQRIDSNDDRRGCKKSVQYWVSSIFTRGRTFQEQNYYQGIHIIACRYLKLESTVLFVFFNCF